jgi:hypothetical protein
VPAHSSLGVLQYLTRKGLSVMDHALVLSWFGSSWLLAVSRTKRECWKERVSWTLRT